GQDLDRLLPRADLAAEYLRVVSFGSVVPGHEAIGICAAARTAYGRPVDALRIEELAELIGRLPATERLIPVRRQWESDDGWAHRFVALQENHAAVVSRLKKEGIVREAPADPLPVLAPAEVASA